MHKNSYKTTMNQKIIVWIDNDLMYFGLSKSLQEQYDCDLYAIIDVVDRQKKFFLKQPFVKFHNVWYYHDHISKSYNKIDLEFLKSFEDKYKINLWLLACNDRIFYNFNYFYNFKEIEVLSILEQECKFFEKILDDINPDFLIMPRPPLQHSYLFYELCKKRNIKVLDLQTTRIANKCIISMGDDTYGYKPDVNQKNHVTFEELQVFHKKFTHYEETKSVGKRFLHSKRDLIYAVLQFLFISSNTNPKTHYTYYGRTKIRVLIHYIIYAIKTRFRKKFIDKNFIRKIDDKTSFIFFPLHIEQERTLLIEAPFYTNQLEVIKHIVKSLPIGYKLYVKEHPTMFARGWRKISLYKEIMRLPNVVLIHPSVLPDEILRKCSLIISITGTTSFDAGFYKKPSIALAQTAWSMLSYVHKLKSLDELPDAIKSSLKKEVNASDLFDYINFIEKNSFTFDVYAFAQDHQDYFHYGGFLVDVDIPIDKMKYFLKVNKEKYDLLAKEHIKKITI